MIGAEPLGHQIGVLELVAGFASRGLEADTEGLQAMLTGLGQQGHDQGRVDAPGEQHADRHVGHHPALSPPAQRRR